MASGASKGKTNMNDDIYLVLTQEAVAVIRGAAHGEFRQTGHRLTDGTWSVPFRQETVDRIKARQLLGETISDTLIRIMALACGAGKN
jgi:hypothetical protein